MEQSVCVRTASLVSLIIMFLFLSWPVQGQDTSVDTFTVTITFAKSTIHVNEMPELDVVIENRTNHVVYPGWVHGGNIVEIVNDKGEDIGTHFSRNGNRSSDLAHADEEMLRSPVKILRPNGKFSDEVTIDVDRQYLKPGIYKVRVHRLDYVSKKEIYSNVLTLTVLP